MIKPQSKPRQQVESKPVNKRRAARLAAGLSGKQAAKECGLRLSSFTTYEQRGFTYYRAELLSLAYGCRLEILK